MDQYIIKGGTALAGEVVISGAKNSALGILAAAVLTDETVCITGILHCCERTALWHSLPILDNPAWRFCYFICILYTLLNITEMLVKFRHYVGVASSIGYTAW